MTIEIHRPELEALILERMKSGAFRSVEDVLMAALESAAPSTPPKPARTGTDLVAAMQSSPHKEIDLTPMRHRLPVRELAS